MKRFAWLLIGLTLVSTGIGCCGMGCGGRPLLGMAYDQPGYQPAMAAAPGCACGM